MVNNISPTFVDNGRYPEDGKAREGRIWKQWILSLVAYTPITTSTLQMVYLSKNTEELPSSYPVPWSSTALLLATVAAAPTFCWIADRFGRKVALFLTTVLQIISWIPLLFDSTTPPIYILVHAILGLALGAIYTITPIYVREMSEDRTRGIQVLFLVIMKTLGSLAMKVMERYLAILVIEYLVIGLLAVQSLLVYFLSESPVYFFKKGDDEQATQLFAKLKGLKEKSNIVKNQIDEWTKERDIARLHGNLSLINIFRNQIWRNGIKIGVILHTVFALGGHLIFLDHVRVLQKSGVVIDEGTWSVAVPGLMFLGGIVAVAFVDVWDRKYIVAGSLSIMTLFMGILAVFMQADMEATSVPWLPMTCLLIVIFGYSLGWGLPFLVLTEVFNLEIRTTLIGILFAYYNILELIHIHIFAYIEDYVGIYTIFYIFAGINMYGAVYTLFGLPDCKNKTVKNIEKQMKKVPIL